MSHRKFERPRHGNLAFLPRKRCSRHRGKVRSFPADDPKQDCHLTAFMGFKAGMTHIVRDVERPGSKIHKKEVVEATSVVEVPPMVVVGMTGYVKTTKGLRCLCNVWAEHLSEQFKRKMYRNWAASKKRAFCKVAKNYNSEKAQSTRKQKLAALTNKACVIRVIAHTQVRKMKMGRKKADVIEIQVNGGSVADKVAFAQGLFEKEISITTLFKEGEMIDICSVTKGHGFEGVTHRWGTTRLPRKTHRGLRKVACIGAWHPARVAYSVGRAGQHGYHHRTEINKKIYKIGESIATNPANAVCATDLTNKAITPMGGFVNYGTVKNEYLLIKGCVGGPKRRPIVLRRSLIPTTSRRGAEAVNLKFIDTSSKIGRGRFQTTEEKRKFLGPGKRSVAAEEKKKEAEKKKAK
eukprot:TRINITY_DN1331_c1_g1_i1.p1 TRINITY_DN1331_c1_g1~~TRINITY_DN1331_c1_g1_i1.p1  ORF type:complete len:415 (+),score=62.44 TRINITY_DN1331_c1_g1_i1:25-1245(+)